MKIFLISILIFFANADRIFSQYSENYAASFNGFSSYASVPSTSGLSPSIAITLEAWVYPTQILGTTMGIIGKNYQTSYFLGIQSSGRLVFYPKGSASLRSRVTGTIPVNQWTHIAATYSGTVTSIYINGVLDTSTAAITGPLTTNSDSLFMGADRVGGLPSLFYRGRLDNVRIWGVARSASEISTNRFSPLEIVNPLGVYAHLRASFQFDNNCLNYGGSELNLGTGRNITYIDYTDKAVKYLDYNNSLVLNGTSDYIFLINDPVFNATSAITLEAWIKRDTTGAQPNDQYIISKSGGADRFNYALWLHSASGTLKFKINSATGPPGIISYSYILNSQWTHVAATYNSATGSANLYINGYLVSSGIFTGNPQIQNDPDHIFIGEMGASNYSGNKFKGQIDGIRIWKTERSSAQIKEKMHNYVSNIDLASIDFDKYTNSIRNYNTIILSGAVFTGGAQISSANQHNNSRSSSPVFSGGNSEFILSGYTGSQNRFFIPDNSPQGKTDSVYISSGGVVLNIKAYVLMSHTYSSDVKIDLISPLGVTVSLLNRKGSYGNDIMTLFSDGADSSASSVISLEGPGISPPFSPSVKPDQPLSVLNGQTVQGWWKMKFSDNEASDRGYVLGWGVNIFGVPVKTLKLTGIIQGLYNSVTNKMLKDTARIFLRESVSPYNFIDTAKAVIDSAGTGSFNFTKVYPGQEFYMVVSHRNSIETWSSGGYEFNSDTLQYNFTLAASQAFGSNQINVDNSPVKFAIYSGDVNQDGTIDLSDVSQIDNDAFNFVSGYLPTDINGDEVIDLADAVFADNNAFNFVSKIAP
ncbi:MAG: proprotein convertase P-domain-containing protein [Ignavibacteria bacterium]|nr:proprotein convertase P-domain-containing protein [Ignavibacteria bacterium]